MYRYNNLSIGFPTSCEADEQNIDVALGTFNYMFR